MDPVHLLEESQDIKVVRLTASLFFGNNEEMKTEFEGLLSAGGDDGQGEGLGLGGGTHRGRSSSMPAASLTWT